MKIEIEIPEWAEERHIYVMAGIELLAKKEYCKPLMIKTERCNACGKCCMDLPPKHPMGVTEEGWCNYLVKEPGNNNMYVCGMYSHRPFGCCVAEPYNIPDCPVKYEVIE
jgi:hypothetical protein